MHSWYPEYVKFIDDTRNTPFEWGKNDCGIAWAGKIVEIVRGEPLDIEMGNYSTPIGAVRTMRKMGYANLREAAEGILGVTSHHPSMGAIGDLALIKTDDAFGYAFGIVNGERVFFRQESGIGTLDLLEAECIFKL